ncbi:hypothetical protein HanXRQr2_Chr13g0589071 [Helianthus annuus]|uniref:Uncharacterized protein n=1 Tax=Helianthus annuus TaxID=4232 RepID=A0A9K3EI35_HELAN|nr:hypothetical protein HanXRQr2_Chr13g0589071 [Helianthus annuus]KAJ0849316.1 hypothetical protein HanPSC8_Chr13g0567391 [Helianthus annuus]
MNGLDASTRRRFENTQPVLVLIESCYEENDCILLMKTGMIQVIMSMLGWGAC